jgi:CBS domain-containing protein
MADRESLGARTIGHIMTKNVVTVDSESTVDEAVKLMHEKNIGSIVVLREGKVEGILTETDLLRNIASGDGIEKKVKDVMTSPIMTAEASMPMLEASKLMQAHGFRRLPVVEDNKLAGIVTETDLTRAMESTGIWKKIGNIMTKDLVTARREDTVVKAAELMTTKNVGSVIIVDNEGGVEGIMTEKDILVKVLGERRNPATTLVSEVMTSPAVTVNPELSVYSASKFMEEHKFRRLPITDKGKLVGIVTQTDLSNVMRSVIIEIVPEVEKELKDTPLEYQLEKGKGYLIEEKKPIRCFEIFEDMVKHGYMGLCIARTNPKRIRETYGLEATPIVWVTDIMTEETKLEPTDLNGISKAVSEFIQKAEKGVVFLEALMYLTVHNDFNRVLQVIQHIKDVISESNSSLMVYVDPVLLTEHDLKLLMQEMDEVKFRAY